jgi:alpha-L-fucosidase
MAYENFKRFERPVPNWFTDAKFGIFIHWGAYSVPAWAEPIGELGTINEKEWFKHNPYAEWYFNTIRIEGSPAQEHHKKNYNGCDYDDLLDLWKASKFNPDDWASLFKRAGAQYIIPTTKHHDGITLWDAPGTDTRNTVARGPKKDLVQLIGDAVRKQGIKFGVYYSGGLDWSISQLPPIIDGVDVTGLRPSDAAYAMYCYEHIIDLIDKYKPDVLWDDIEYPNFAKREGEYSLAAIFEHYYKTVPQGVVNDRWGVPFQDYKTSEYQHSLANETGGAWENCRGIGYSFGYNQIETEEHYMSINQALHHLCDIVSRGGNLLLNIGPTADGEIPPFQVKVLEGVGSWLAVNGEAIYATVKAGELTSSDSPWVRWTAKSNKRYAIIDAIGGIKFSAPASIDEGSAHVLGGSAISVTRSGSELSVTIPAPAVDGPTVIAFNTK